MDSRHFPESIKLLAELWDEFPDESRFGVKLFNCFLNLDDVQNAETALQRLVKEKKRYAKLAADELRELKEELGEIKPDDMPQKDIRKLMRLRRRASTNPNAFAYMRGSLLCAKGDYENAIEALKNAEGAQTYNQPSLRQKMGECYVGLEQWAEAKEQFEQMLNLDPANAGAYLGLAQCELASSHPNKAASAARSAIGLIYHNPKAHYLWAVR